VVHRSRARYFQNNECNNECLGKRTCWYINIHTTLVSSATGVETTIPDDGLCEGSIEVAEKIATEGKKEGDGTATDTNTEVRRRI